MPVSSGGFPQAIRVSRYSRAEKRKTSSFRLRGHHPLWLPLSSGIRLTAHLVTLLPASSAGKFPSYDCISSLRTKHSGLFRVRSPLLTESQLFTFPPGTEMFYFPGCAPQLTSGSPWFTRRGFPIRTSPDQRLLGTSPKRIAATPRPSSLLPTKASTIRPYLLPTRPTPLDRSGNQVTTYFLVLLCIIDPVRGPVC